MSELLEKAQSARQCLKVFPLPSVVLLPGAALPLHIFELRYREMVKDALAGDSLISLAGVLPGHERELAGSPPLEPIACVGTIGFSEQLPDGRYNVVLVGISRVRIVGEVKNTKPYREIQVELLPDGPASADPEAMLKTALMDLVARLPLPVGQRFATMGARVKGGALADVLAASLDSDPARHFEVLNELDVDERIRSVIADIKSVINRLKPAKHSGLLN